MLIRLGFVSMSGDRSAVPWSLELAHPILCSPQLCGMLKLFSRNPTCEFFSPHISFAVLAPLLVLLHYDYSSLPENPCFMCAQSPPSSHPSPLLHCLSCHAYLIALTHSLDGRKAGWPIGSLSVHLAGESGARAMTTDSADKWRRHSLTRWERGAAVRREDGEIRKAATVARGALGADVQDKIA